MGEINTSFPAAAEKLVWGVAAALVVLEEFETPGNAWFNG